MSERCQFYRTEFKITRENAQHPGAREFAPKRVAVSYCAHAQSPVPKGANKALSCGGDLAKCLIPGAVV